MRIKGDTLFAIIFLVVGIFCLVFLSIPGWYDNIRSANWPTTNGTILSSELQSSEGSGPYSAKIQYQYSVNGANYTSDKISFMDIAAGGGRQAVEQFPVGKVVPVYYNPNNPSEAVLEPAVIDTFRIAEAFGVPILFICVATAMLVLGKKGKIKKEDENNLREVKIDRPTVSPQASSSLESPGEKQVTGIKELLSKIPFWIFCISMILFFYTGLAYPEQTGYWLVKDGMIIIILEFISIFSTMSLLETTNKEAVEKSFTVTYGGYLADKLSEKAMNWIGFAVVMLMALFFTSFYNLWLFVYFLLTNAIKYIGFRQVKTTSINNARIKALGVTVISIVLSGLIGAVSSLFLKFLFSDQLKLLYKFQEQNFTSFGLIEVFAFWGILYYAFLIFFDWSTDYYESKTGKPAIRPYK